MTRHFLRDDDLSPDGQQSVDEAENRLHAQKAALCWLLARAS